MLSLLVIQTIRLQPVGSGNDSKIVLGDPHVVDWLTGGCSLAYIFIFCVVVVASRV